MLSYNKGMGSYFREGTDVVHFVEDGTTWKSLMNRKDQNNNQNSVSVI